MRSKKKPNKKEHSLRTWEKEIDLDPSRTKREPDPSLIKPIKTVNKMRSPRSWTFLRRNFLSLNFAIGKVVIGRYKRSNTMNCLTSMK